MNKTAAFSGILVLLLMGLAIYFIVQTTEAKRQQRTTPSDEIDYIYGAKEDLSSTQQQDLDLVLQSLSVLNTDAKDLSADPSKLDAFISNLEKQTRKVNRRLDEVE